MVWLRVHALTIVFSQYACSDTVVQLHDSHFIHHHHQCLRLDLFEVSEML
jgi:hypothetical protein